MGGFLGQLLGEARTLRPRQAWRDIVRGFDENDLLAFASAIAFRITFALIPLALLGLALLGSFGLDDVWRTDVAPDVRDQVSTAAFQVIDQTVGRVLASKQLIWATLGAVIAIWEVSSGMRAVMDVLNRVYHAPRERDFKNRVLVSLWLATIVTVMLLAAVACVKVLPALLGGGVMLRLAGWAAGLALLLLTVGMIVRFAPCRDRPVRWVSFGAVVVVVGWIAAALLFSWYASSIADYGSLFGSLAVVMVGLASIYGVALVFVTGLQLDALIRDSVERGAVKQPSAATASSLRKPPIPASAKR
jgi:membrane protein